MLKHQVEFFLNFDHLLTLPLRAASQDYLQHWKPVKSLKAAGIFAWLKKQLLLSICLFATMAEHCAQLSCISWESSKAKNGNRLLRRNSVHGCVHTDKHSLGVCTHAEQPEVCACPALWLNKYDCCLEGVFAKLQLQERGHRTSRAGRDQGSLRAAPGPVQHHLWVHVCQLSSRLKQTQPLLRENFSFQFYVCLLCGKGASGYEQQLPETDWFWSPMHQHKLHGLLTLVIFSYPARGLLRRDPLVRCKTNTRATKALLQIVALLPQRNCSSSSSLWLRWFGYKQFPCMHGLFYRK